jgi:hypothetical protein
MRVRNVFFGGGFDSTYHVLNLINSNLYDKILCLYLKNVDLRLNTEVELKTLYRLKERYPNIIEIKLEEEPPKETEITENYIKKGLETDSLMSIEKSEHFKTLSKNPFKYERDLLRYTMKEWLSNEWAYNIYNTQTCFLIEYTFSEKNVKNDLYDVCTVRNERNWNRFFCLPYNLDRDKTQDKKRVIYDPSMIKNYGTLNCKPNIEDYPEIYEMKYLRLPIFHLSKRDCSELAITQNNFTDEQVKILTDSQTCREGNDGPCGKCHLCWHRSGACENVSKYRRKMFIKSKNIL